MAGRWGPWAWLAPRRGAPQDGLRPAHRQPSHRRVACGRWRTGPTTCGGRCVLRCTRTPTCGRRRPCGWAPSLVRTPPASWSPSSSPSRTSVCGRP
ncbi:hypothetical protein [Ornithinimicrobium kibberense]|uniref:hypothetical protein n=1 Tax=Ornithinimicrobium kibberense TaxID=282060 RepID=UPI00361B71B5